jgi:hypothetical protein
MVSVSTTYEGNETKTVDGASEKYHCSLDIGVNIKRGEFTKWITGLLHNPVWSYEVDYWAHNPVRPPF